MKLSDIAIDPVKLEQGDWVDKIPLMGELRLRVRGVNNADYRKLQATLLDAEPRQFKRDGRLRPDRQDALQATLLMNTVLIDWEGVLDENDQPIPYSKEMAKTLLTEPRYRNFRDAVAWAASVVADEVQEEIEADGKNSPQPSGGS